VQSRCDGVVEVQPIRCRPFRLSVPHWLDCGFRFHNPLIEPVRALHSRTEIKQFHFAPFGIDGWNQIALDTVPG
jgi:hypothetical protein